VADLEIYLRNISVFGKGKGGSSDITLQNKNNGKWVFLSSKFLEFTLFLIIFLFFSFTFTCVQAVKEIETVRMTSGFSKQEFLSNAQLFYGGHTLSKVSSLD
jgi:hypothetical protein